MAWNISFESSHSLYIYHWPDGKSSRESKTRQETRDNMAKVEELLQPILIYPISLQFDLSKPKKCL